MGFNASDNLCGDWLEDSQCLLMMLYSSTHARGIVQPAFLVGKL